MNPAVNFSPQEPILQIGCTVRGEVYKVLPYQAIIMIDTIENISSAINYTGIISAQNYPSAEEFKLPSKLKCGDIVEATVISYNDKGVGLSCVKEDRNINR